MRIISILLIVFLFTFGSCNNNASSGNASSSDSSNHTAPVKAPVASKLSEVGTQKLMGVVTTYYTYKNAMVATKADDAVKAATELVGIADSFLAYLQKDTASLAQLKPYTDTIVTQSKIAASLNDPTCEKYRIVFEPISSAVYGLLKKAEVKNVKIYHEFCPMAFNDKGAFWLSDESEIKNPYFGKKMLECGEVTDSL